MIASEEPWQRAPVVSPGALKRLASMRMQRCSISAVCGYSAWSMKLRCRFSAISSRTSGPIQVVTKVARLRSGSLSSSSSSSISSRASCGFIPSAGISLSGAATLRKPPRSMLSGNSGMRSGASFAMAQPYLGAPFTHHPVRVIYSASVWERHRLTIAYVAVIVFLFVQYLG